jgi:hypothetical protein
MIQIGDRARYNPARKICGFVVKIMLWICINGILVRERCKNLL